MVIERLQTAAFKILLTKLNGTFLQHDTNSTDFSIIKPATTELKFI